MLMHSNFDENESFVIERDKKSYHICKKKKDLTMNAV
jgi:hypothetical protein